MQRVRSIDSREPACERRVVAAAIPDDPRVVHAARNPACGNYRPKGVEAEVRGELGAFAAMDHGDSGGMVAQQIFQAEDRTEYRIQPGKAAVDDPDLDGIDGRLDFVAPTALRHVELIQWLRCGQYQPALGRRKKLRQARSRDVPPTPHRYPFRDAEKGAGAVLDQPDVTCIAKSTQPRHRFRKAKVVSREHGARAGKTRALEPFQIRAPGG